MPKSDKTDQEKINIINIYNNNKISLSDLSKKFGVPITTISSWLNDVRYNDKLTNTSNLGKDTSKFKLHNECESSKRIDEIIKNSLEMANTSLEMANNIVNYYIKS